MNEHRLPALSYREDMEEGGEDAVRVRPVTDVPWADVETVFGTRGDPSRCWCQYFKLAGDAWRGSTREECRESLREQVQVRPGPGLLAYLGSEPVGWCAVEPRPGYERLRNALVSRGSPEPFEDDSVWVIPCLVVRPGYRKRGIGRALVAAAVAHAGEHGARVIEAYPVDPDERPQVSAAELYHGTVSVFQDAGLEVAARPLPGRALMRLTVDRSAGSYEA